MKGLSHRYAVILAVSATALIITPEMYGASRKERYEGIRIAELEAKVAVCHILDELALSQLQKEVLMECRQRFAPLADKCHKTLHEWIGVTEPWEYYASVGLKGQWPTGKMLRWVQKEETTMLRVKRPIYDQINPISENFASELSNHQRERLRKLSEENFVGKGRVLGRWAPDDLETSELSDEQRYMIRHRAVKYGMPSREAQLVMAPFLEDAMAKRIKGGQAAMGYSPQTDPDESARFPAYWDYDMWRQYNDRMSWFAKLTYITGLNPQPEQSMEILDIMDKRLEDTGKTATPYDVDYSTKEGRAYCRELEGASKRLLKGRKLDDDDMRELQRAAGLFWKFRESGRQKRAKATAKIRDEVREILTAGQEKYTVQLHLCPVPFESNISSSKAGQVASDFAAVATKKLDEIKRIRNWEGDNAEKTRLTWLKRFSPGYAGNRLNDRQKQEAYDRMMSVVTRAREMDDGEYLAKRDGLGEELLWLNDMRTPDLLRENKSIDHFDDILYGRINGWFIHPHMQDVLGKRLKAMERGVAQSE